MGHATMKLRALTPFCILLTLVMLSGCTTKLIVEPPTQTGSPVESGSVTMTPKYAATGQGGSVQFQATVAGGGSLMWLVNGIPGGNDIVGKVDASGKYTAPGFLPQSENVAVTAAASSSPQTNYATSIVSLIHHGVVTATANPQVATYTIDLPAPGSVYIEFGPTTSYGLPTWVQSATAQNGGAVAIYVAGMLAQTEYHMRARVTLEDGATFTDTDETFTTGTPPATAAVTASTVAGYTPQSGVELFDTVLPHEAAQAFATDLAGNVIWTYSYVGTKLDFVQPIKLLPNGHFLAQISYASSIGLKGATITPQTLDEVREVDLAGNTIRSVTWSQLNQALIAEGYNFELGSLHHDVLPLPNGHILLLMSVYKSYDNLPGYPGTTKVLGDLLIDVDQNFKPDWVWNTFDHLDINRHPYLFPDWTHANAMLYSADDHNVLLSVRHQNWIIKIDFEDGQGSGNILWRLGEGGDFKLVGGTDPTDWFYAQHGPNYFSTNTTGVFKLGVFDNGDDRELPGGVVCGTTGAPACYSTAPIFQIDESAMTATLIEHYIPPASLYSFFGGTVNPLANGDMEADFCSTVSGAVLQELNISGGAPQLVWQAKTSGADQYRTDRLPSLYPGVQW